MAGGRLRMTPPFLVVGFESSVPCLLFLVCQMDKVELYRKRGKGFPVLVGVVFGMAIATLVVVWLTPVRAIDLVPSRYATLYEQRVIGRGGTGDDQSLTDFLRQRVQQRAVQDVPSTILPGMASGAVWNLADAFGARALLTVLGVLVTGLLFLGLLRWMGQDRVSAFLAVVPAYALALAAWDWMGPRLL